MIRVSDIATYLRCPRMCYFVNRGHELIKDVSTRHLEGMLLKELALTYCTAFNAEDKLSFLNDELSRISDEIRLIYRAELAGVDDSALANAVSCVRSSLEEICSNLSSSRDYYACPCEVEPALLSEKFGLTGSPDKLIKSWNEPVPSIVKTGAMPQNGVWKSDRLQLTAYAILVEETYNSVVGRGFVEYARWGTVRDVTIKRHERRKVLQLRDRIRKIHEGFMPERPEDAPCEHCRFEEMCQVKSTLAARFF